MRPFIRSFLLLCAATAHAASTPAADTRIADLKSDQVAVRVTAAKTLGRAAQSSAVPPLIDALSDTSPAVRREAAKALGQIKDSRAADALIKSLSDPDKNVRHYVAYALGEIKDPRATGVLLDALDDAEWCVRDQAAWALREIADPQMAGQLARAMATEHADLAQLVWILRGIPDADVIGPLTGLLQHADVETRLRAVEVLGSLPDAKIVAPLVAALRDSGPAVRRSAVVTLVKIGDERVKQPLRDLAARETDPKLKEFVESAVLQMSYEKDLVAHWSFDDRSTSAARDVTGNGNDGQIVGCTPVTGKVGAALQFGKGKYIELGRPAGLPIGNVPFTVVAWIKSDAPRGVVVARGGAACGYSLYVMDHVAKFGIHRTEEEPAYIAAGRENVVGPWVHLAGVVRKDRIELFVNGKLATTADTAGYIPGNCGQGMEIGYDAGNSPAEIIDHFQGIIDEVKTFQAALTAEDIAAECEQLPAKDKEK